MGVGSKSHSLAAVPPGMTQYSLWATGPAWKCAENHAVTGIRTRGRPAHSESFN